MLQGIFFFHLLRERDLLSFCCGNSFSTIPALNLYDALFCGKATLRRSPLRPTLTRLSRKCTPGHTCSCTIGSDVCKSCMCTRESRCALCAFLSITRLSRVHAKAVVQCAWPWVLFTITAVDAPCWTGLAQMVSRPTPQRVHRSMKRRITRTKDGSGSKK